jgi:hypothetical protein
MTKKELISFYEKRKGEFSSHIAGLSRKINLISNARLVLAAVIAATIYFGFTNTILLYSLIFWITFFFILVKRHAQLFDERNHFENLVRINSNEVKGLAGDYSGFAPGLAFLNSHHPYSYDLDIFGEGSVFQIINRSNTLSGVKKFASRLTNPLSTRSEIISEQEAIRELASKPDFRQHFQAAGLEMDEQPKDRQQLLDWIAQPNFLFGKKVYQIILIVVPAVTLALVAGWIYSDTFRPFAILFAAFQWAFLGFHLKRVNEFHEYISRKKNILQKYAHLLLRLRDERFSSPLLKSVQDRSREAGTKVQALASLVHAFDARLNSMTSIFVNSLLLYDLQCVYRLEKWKSENATDLVSWLEAVSDTEVVSSLANFAFNNPHFHYPEINDRLELSAHALGHPLIPEEECVSNDFYLGKNPSVAIVTGANMAGKSTFLRSLGVNLILALNGAPVFAKDFRFPIIKLRTGMRTADSLKDHQSYFYAELDRLKGIMDDLRKDIPLLILLDEILKGTNSTDKQTGSIALVKQLLPHPCLAVIATHDLALGELENEFPGQVKNYCFEANIQNDQLSFDYKLKPGIAQKMNATFLMKKMGIIPQ